MVKQGEKIEQDPAGGRLGRVDGGKPPRDRQRAPGRRQTLAQAAGLGLAALAVLAGCAGPGHPSSAQPAGTDTASGQRLGRQELLARMAGADIVLLGELHDNTGHHAQRGAWLAQLAAQPALRPWVVAEHLPRGRQVTPPAPGAPVLATLEAAGFDARGWAWPAHQPLFETLLAAGLPLWGGNLPRDEARRIAREGEAAWPPDLAALLQRAPLPPAALQTLDASLLDSHCGMLPASRVPAMRAAQRARDASMAQALLAAHAQGARPAVLLTGNGHVRKDHGVAQLLATLAPQLRVLSVALLEHPPGGTAELLADVAWTEPAPPGQPRRQDPCAAMKATAAPAQAVAPGAPAGASSAPTP